MNKDKLTPKQIVHELDKYIIGQDKAKKAVAIALRNRWRRLQLKDDLREEVMPNNIIMIGSTGVGKTEIARRLALLSNAPFVKVEASKYTEVGYVGRDVESMIRDLTDLAVNMVKEERTGQIQDEAGKNAEERLLNLLLPFPNKKKDQNTASNESDDETKKRWERTKEKMRKQLVEGNLEDRMVDLDVPDERFPRVEVFSPVGIEEIGINIQELIGDMVPKRKKKRTVKIKEARTILKNEEVGKLVEMDKVIKESIRRVETSGFIFIDEIDKVTGKDSRTGPDVSREGVQRDLLPIVEGCTVATKYGMVKTEHILFIAAGAFHNAKPSDLIPEFQGRFPIRVELDSLSVKDFVKILTKPKNALIKQYAALLKTDKVSLTFSKTAINEIAHMAAKANDQLENIGARRLHTIMTLLLEDILFNAPEAKLKKITITDKIVRERLMEILQSEDLSKYVL